MEFTTEQVWENYGDINPIEHGGTWIKPDVPTFPRCFYIVEASPRDDVYGWFVSDGYVDLNDDWIEWDKVFSYADVNWNDPDEILAIALFQYYGPLEFQGECKALDRESKLIAKLKDWEIEVEKKKIKMRLTYS